MMRIQDMIDMLPPRDDVIRLARYFAQARQPDYSSLVVTAAAGVIVGAAVALLFAPKNGRELRQAIGEQAETLRDKAQELGSRVRTNGPGITHTAI